MCGNRENILVISSAFVRTLWQNDGIAVGRFSLDLSLKSVFGPLQVEKESGRHKEYRKDDGVLQDVRRHLMFGKKSAWVKYVHISIYINVTYCNKIILARKCLSSP